jgi:2-polyprenyl-3-methyl-5-hydroxy-6-metoxy-1,4-benzoquinol methylase
VIPEVSVVDKYDVEVDPDVPSSHSRVLRLVNPGSAVLDLGCATGALGAALREQGCRVVGVERDKEAAEIARDRLDAVYEIDLVTGDLSALADEGPFDAIVLADVLEHLVEPQELLRALPPLLAQDGLLITSIPNVAHGSVRLALLAGQFPYRETGLLDSTHVRFFTRESMAAMLAAGGFHTVYIEEHVVSPEAGEVLEGVDLDSLPPEARQAVLADPDSNAYQFISVSCLGTPRGLAAALERQGRESSAAQILAATQAESQERALRIAELEAQAGQRDVEFAEAVATRDRLGARVKELESIAAMWADVLAASAGTQEELRQAQGELVQVRAQLSEALLGAERLRSAANETLARMRNEMATHATTRRTAAEWEQRAAHFEALCHEAAADARAARSSATWRVGSLFVAPLSRLRRLFQKRG